MFYLILLAGAWALAQARGVANPPCRLVPLERLLRLMKLLLLLLTVVVIRVLLL